MQIKLNLKKLPKHVALIMDGNRRWAKAHHLPIFQGHLEGQARIEPLIDYAIGVGIPYLTFWAFSTENWRRSQREVNFLLKLFRDNLNKQVDRFHQKKVRLKVIGDLTAFPLDLQQKTNYWLTKTKNNRQITVTLALNYGGRNEIIRAIKKIRKDNLPEEQLTAKSFSAFLDTADLPDPDLLIRTGGELRLSGFMLWQLEYTELYFTQTCWPDFTPIEFEKALLIYQNRKRNFGC